MIAPPPDGVKLPGFSRAQYRACLRFRPYHVPDRPPAARTRPPFQTLDAGLHWSPCVKQILPILCGLTLTFGGTAAGVQPPAPSKHPMLHEYRRKVLSPQAAGRSLAGAGINQARNYPHEWGQGAGGFAKRAASGFAQHAIKEGIEIPMAKALHQDLHYQRSHLQGTWPRLQYAVKSTFIVPRTNKPGKTVATSRIAANMGAGLVSRAWMPASAASVGAGLASGGVGIGADVGVHVAREFWPQRKAQRH